MYSSILLRKGWFTPSNFAYNCYTQLAYAIHTTRGTKSQFFIIAKAVTIWIKMQEQQQLDVFL